MERELLEVFEGHADDFDIDAGGLLDVGEHEGVIAELIDAAGETIAGLGDEEEGLHREEFGGGLSGVAGPKVDVLHRLLAVEKWDGVLDGDALTEGGRGRFGEAFVERGLSGEEDLDERGSFMSEVGEEANFFEESRGEEVSLIENEDGSFGFPDGGFERGDEFEAEFLVGFPLIGLTEFEEDGLEEGSDSGELAGTDVGDEEAFLEFAGEVLDHEGLADAGLSGDDGDSLLSLDGGDDVAVDAGETWRGEVTASRVWGCGEWPTGELEEIGVHIERPHTERMVGEKVAIRTFSPRVERIPLGESSTEGGKGLEVG